MDRFRPQIIRYDSLPSTNTEVARLASQGAVEGLSVVADEQTAGRGRLQRTWQSPRGSGLYLSVLLRPVLAIDLWPLITFAAALSVTDALRETCNLDTDIKWPNDILSGERKLCGILAETIDTQRSRAVVLGIGINLNKHAFPPELSGVATSVEDAVGVSVDREVVLLSVLDYLRHWYSLLQQEHGSDAILDEWSNRSSYTNEKLVKVVNGNELVEGTTCGLETDGALRLKTQTGEIKIIRAGDVMNLRSS